MKNKPIRSPKHLKYVRSLPCMIRNSEGEHCNGHVVSHHCTFVDKKGGVGVKTCDSKSVPLSVQHHMELHRIGEKTFWAKYGYSLEEVEQYADELWDNFNERY